MASRLLTLAVWAVVLASAVFWGLKVFASRTGVPAQAQMPARTLAMGGELRKLLGTSEKPQDDDGEIADASDRFHLLGVVAPRGAGHSPQGVALIAVGDEPAKALRTGSVIDGDTVLLAVNQRSVQLGPRGGPATTELNLPEPTPIAVPARSGATPLQRPVPMMPSGAQPGQGMQQHPPAAPAAQPVQRAGQPAQQEDDDAEED
jgi:general secretion pathway protein C